MCTSSPVRERPSSGLNLESAWLGITVCRRHTNRIQRIVEAHSDELIAAWDTHFG